MWLLQLLDRLVQIVVNAVYVHNRVMIRICSYCDEIYIHILVIRYISILWCWIIYIHYVMIYPYYGIRYIFILWWWDKCPYCGDMYCFHFSAMHCPHCGDMYCFHHIVVICTIHLAFPAFWLYVSFKLWWCVCVLSTLLSYMYFPHCGDKYSAVMYCTCIVIMCC